MQLYHSWYFELKEHKEPHILHRDTVHPCLLLFYSQQQEMEPARMPINRRADNENVVHIYTMKFYSTPKKWQATKCARKWMKLEIIIVREAAQTQKDKNHIFFFIHGPQIGMCIHMYINGYK